jgi:hypothetical protein
MLEIHVLAWDRHYNVAELYMLLGSLDPLDNWISYKQIYTYIYINIYKQMIKKNMHRFASTQKV